MKFSMTARQGKKRRHLNIGDSLRGDHMGRFESTIKPQSVLITLYHITLYDLNFHFPSQYISYQLNLY